MELILKLIGSKWDPIEPFHRARTKTVDDLLDGEREYDVCSEYVHLVEWNGSPPKIIKLSADEIQNLLADPIGFRSDKILYRKKCFLWVIDGSGLKIVREMVRNTKRAHDPDFICHTNLTNGGTAYIGGEILFGDSGQVFINNFSDRYGGPQTPSELWDATKDLFRKLGYENLVDLLELV